MKVDLMVQVGRWAVIYFAGLFGAGFVLGVIRVPILEPRLGVRIAELVEAPFMLLAISVAGRWIGTRIGSGNGAGVKLAVGVLTAGLVLGADVVVGVMLRKMSALEVFTTRDPVSGLVYYGLIACAAAAPWVMSLY